MELKDFINLHGITMTSDYASTNPHMVDPTWDADHWKVTLKMGRKSMTTYFSMGTAYRGTEPTAEDVLDSLASDASTVDNAQDFEDFCAELGFDSDSRKALATYTACLKYADRLRSFLGDDRYDTLLYNTERL